MRIDELPAFTLKTADLMRYDPQVRIGLGARNGLLMAAQVEVPPEHVTQGRAAPGLQRGADPANSERLMRIQSSSNKPADAAVAVSYRDVWFWVDDRDLKSKRALAFMLLLFTLADTGEKENLPLITIPAQ